MPDLSSYIDFSVRFDLTTGTPKMILEDTSSYPSGVNEDITGYFSITSPDGGTDSGSWSSPDVTWDGSSLTDKELVLRLNSDGNIQSGNYTVVYNIDHPSYTPTVLSRTFNTSYIPPTLNLVKSFDVFTPELKYHDQTSYGIPGYSYEILDRLWEYSSDVFGGESSDPTLDLVYQSQYYDAEYSISFYVDVFYESNTYGYLSIRDVLTKYVTASANTPPSINDLVEYLNDLKADLDANVDNCTLHKEYKARYEYAASLLFNIKEACRAGLLEPLNRYVEEFLSITNNFVTPPYTNTNEAIEPYDCGSAGAASTYKVYTALLSQYGTNAPVATVLENTLGGTVVWAYSSTGSYSATLAGAFPANKLFFIVQQEAAYNIGPQLYNQKIRSFTRVNNDIVFLNNTELTFTAGAFTSAGNFNNFSNVGIEIRVYD